MSNKYIRFAMRVAVLPNEIIDSYEEYGLNAFKLVNPTLGKSDTLFYNIYFKKVGSDRYSPIFIKFFNIEHKGMGAANYETRVERNLERNVQVNFRGNDSFTFIRKGEEQTQEFGKALRIVESSCLEIINKIFDNPNDESNEYFEVPPSKKTINKIKKKNEEHTFVKKQKKDPDNLDDYIDIENPDDYFINAHFTFSGSVDDKSPDVECTTLIEDGTIKLDSKTFKPMRDPDDEDEPINIGNIEKIIRMGMLCSGLIDANRVVFHTVHGICLKLKLVRLIITPPPDGYKDGAEYDDDEMQCIEQPQKQLALSEKYQEEETEPNIDDIF